MFSPIAFAVQLAYDWSDGTVAMMLNWAPIMVMAFLVPVSYLFSRAGLRYMAILVRNTFFLRVGV